MYSRVGPISKTKKRCNQYNLTYIFKSSNLAYKNEFPGRVSNFNIFKSRAHPNVQSFPWIMQRHFMINLAGLYAVTNHVKRMDTSTKETFTFVVISKLVVLFLHEPISRL